MPECYIRGSTIKYLRIPDEVIDMVKEEVIQKSKGRRDSRGRGGRGGRGGAPRGQSLSSNLPCQGFRLHSRVKQLTPRQTLPVSNKLLIALRSASCVERRLEVDTQSSVYPIDHFGQNSDGCCAVRFVLAHLRLLRCFGII